MNKKTIQAVYRPGLQRFYERYPGWLIQEGKAIYRPGLQRFYERYPGWSRQEEAVLSYTSRGLRRTTGDKLCDKFAYMKKFNPSPISRIIPKR